MSFVIAKRFAVTTLSVPLGAHFSSARRPGTFSREHTTIGGGVMFQLARSARFVAVLALVLGSVACSKTGPENGKEPSAAGPKEPAKAPPKEKNKAEGTKPKSDAELIQGTWAFDWSELDGKKEDGPVDRAVVFAGEKMILKELDGDRADPGSFRLDPTKTQKEIEIGRSERDPKDVVPGIYELNGDQLKICFVRDPKGKRPAKFESAPGSQVLVWVLKRDKTLPEHKEPDGSGFAEAVVGKWRMSRGETAFATFLSDTEFTKDGRVLQLDNETKNWVERYTYRFDKAELVLSPVAKNKDGLPERRIKIARITADLFVAVSPSGTLKRLK
jgi:uncharacterized protein (TIGR03067 family)